MRLFHPLRPITSRLIAGVCSFQGHRRLRRGDHRGAIQSFHRALRRRPTHFPVLMDVAQAHLCAHELPEARRFLAQAREADPSRYDRRAAATLARCGFDLEAVCRPPAAARAGLVAQVAAGRGPVVTAAHLPFGDCVDVDEYARFRAMPPITPAEIDALDWETVFRDLLDEE